MVEFRLERCMLVAYASCSSRKYNFRHNLDIEFLRLIQYKKCLINYIAINYNFISQKHFSVFINSVTSIAFFTHCSGC